MVWPDCPLVLFCAYGESSEVALIGARIYVGEDDTSKHVYYRPN
jgi:hypothetical protein